MAGSGPTVTVACAPRPGESCVAKVNARAPSLTRTSSSGACVPDNPSRYEVQRPVNKSPSSGSTAWASRVHPASPGPVARGIGERLTTPGAVRDR